MCHTTQDYLVLSLNLTKYIMSQFFSVSRQCADFLAGRISMYELHLFYVHKELYYSQSLQCYAPYHLLS